MSGQRSPFERLQAWYRSQCDGDWEHNYGVTIGTLDNPGWEVAIDLADTCWEHLEVEMQREKRSVTDWMLFSVKEQKFDGAGGPENLGDIIEAFLRLVEPPEAS